MASSVSFGFSKTVSKPKVRHEAQLKFSKDAVPEETRHSDDESTTEISSTQDLKTKKPKSDDKLVIPLIRKNEWHFQGSKTGGKLGPDQQQQNVEIKKDDDSNISAAKAALLAEAKQFKEDSEDLFGNAKTVPLIFANKVPEGYETDDKLDPSLRPDEPQEDDYAAVPIEAFGLAVLRGMGWNEGDPIGKSNKRTVTAKIPELRPKGLGLGADKSLVANLKAVGKKNEKGTKGDSGKVMKIGAFVKVLRGPNRDSYGKIESFDVDNARVIVKLALGGAATTVSQFGIELVTQKEYERDGKCINKKQYEKHKDNKAYERNMNLDDDPLGTVVLGNGETKKKKKKKEKRKRSTSPSDSGAKKKPTENVPWIRSDLRVRIVDKSYKGGRYFKEKVTTVDASSPDDCICRTDSGKILEGLKQSLLETVIPRSESSVVMIVKGAQRGEVGSIVKRDSKKCEAVVQLLRHQDSLVTVDFDDISEFVGDTSPYE